MTLRPFQATGADIPSPEADGEIELVLLTHGPLRRSQGIRPRPRSRTRRPRRAHDHHDPRHPLTSKRLRRQQVHHATIPSRALALALALALAAACSDGADAGRSSPDDGTVTTAPAPDPEETEPPSSADADPDAAGTGGSDESGGAGSADASPPDQPLDLEVRHPNGVTLRVSQLSFEEGDIVVDAEVVNSSRAEIVFHFGNVAGERLRLVDDAGVEYNFVEPAEDEGVIKVAAGETLDATLAFRGPLSGQPRQLRLVTNLYPRDLDDFDVTGESDTTRSPGFVVPIDLAGS